MKNRHFRFALIFLLIVPFLLPGTVSAANATDEYEITAYDIQMVVNEDNTFDITETITACFHVAKHGISRKLPLKNTVTRTDGTKSSNRAEVTNIQVSAPYTSSSSSSYYTLKIGDSNKTLTGEKTYTISYTYNIGEDPLPNEDELYFNLIGGQWDTTIRNITFTISMPKSFDASTLRFFSGTTGSTNSSGIDYTVTGDTITGSMSKALSPGQSLTVYLTLPEGYFVGARTISSDSDDFYFRFNTFYLISILISIALVGIAYAIYVKHGKNDPLEETLEFYPPKGLNPAEVGYLYWGKSTTQGVTSLLLYLANKGYLQIEQLMGANFKITKRKEYDGTNVCEKALLRDLFGGRYSYGASPGHYIMAANWEEQCRGIAYIFGGYLNNEFPSKIYDSKEKKYSEKLKWLILPIVVLMGSPLFAKKLGGHLAALILYLLAILLTVFLVWLIKFITNKCKSCWAKLFVWLLFGSPALFGCVLLCISPFIVLFSSKDFLTLTCIIEFACIIAILKFYSMAKRTPRRTPYANEMLGKIYGFREFLMLAESSHIQNRIENDPQYFYEMLSYAHALGISGTWMRAFDSMALDAPDWYVSTDYDRELDFKRFVNSTMPSVEKSMTFSSDIHSRDIHSSDIHIRDIHSSGSNIGGSSGGGSGGGGGSSW